MRQTIKDQVVKHEMVIAKVIFFGSVIVLTLAFGTIFGW
jgi:hypothetical protein